MFRIIPASKDPVGLSTPAVKPVCGRVTEIPIHVLNSKLGRKPRAEEHTSEKQQLKQTV